MCFSATSSFVAAAVTGAIGIGCLMNAPTARHRPLAAMPLLFAAQQAAEGVLWLTLPSAPNAALATPLTLLFLLYAKVFWPIYTPLSILLIEPDARRRTIMLGLLAVGVIVGLILLADILSTGHEAAILGGHIVYGARDAYPASLVAAYLVATCLTPLSSSHAAVRLLGCIVITGASITYAVYWQAFTSVWCFFAALGSAVIYRHFARAAGTRTTVPAA